MNSYSNSTSRQSFTLLQLIICFLALAGLLMLIIPALKVNVEMARSVKCRENISRIYSGLLKYRFDNDGWWPELQIRTQAGLLKDQNLWVNLVSENQYVSELGTFCCPSDPNAPPRESSIREYVRRQVAAAPSYGLNQLTWREYGVVPSDDHGIKRIPTNSAQTILLADLGPDVLPDVLPKNLSKRRQVMEWARDGGRLPPDDGFTVGVVRPAGSWLTPRHNRSTNLMAMGGNASQSHSVSAMMARVPESYYDDCATGACTFCNVFRAAHYDFSASSLYFWTGSYYSPSERSDAREVQRENQD